MVRPKIQTPDTIYPSKNNFDVPELDITLQGDQVDYPVRYFGEIARSSRHKGTYHFFTEDYKFQRVWKDPALITRSACPSVCEVNYSTADQLPFAEALHGIYRKRWLSRHWQGSGIRIWVDLYTHPKFDHISLLGVPKGWKSFAYRTTDARLPELRDRIAFAKKWTGVDKVRMLVVGGSTKTRDFCADNGFHHVMDGGNAKKAVH